MKILRKILTAATAFALSFSPSFASQPPDPSTLSGESAVLMEAGSSEVLYEKNGDAKIFPASTTKIMTAILALENLDLDKSITVPDDFPFVDGSSMYLLSGETFTVREYLEALLVHSANDAAYLLGLEVSGGNIGDFVKKMNDKASELGCTHTHFVNPHGLHDENHYSTAKDMAKIAVYAMQNEEFRKIVSMQGITLHETEKTKEKRMYSSTNRFLWCESPMIYKNEYIPIKYDKIDGIKTGYTLEAGNCLISSATEGEMRLISSVYKASGFDMYRDSRTLIDYGLENFSVQKLVAKGEFLASKNIKLSVQKKLDAEMSRDVYRVMRKGDSVTFEKTVEFGDLKLPVVKGQKVGTITIDVQGDRQKYDVLASNDVESVFTIKHLKEIIFSLPKHLTKRNIMIFVGILILIFIIKRIIKRRRRRYRRYRRY